MEDKTKLILDALEPMFSEAREKGLWFFCGYQELWFSPDELTKAQKIGKFIWGPDNWRLAAPDEQLKRLQHKVDIAQHDLDNFKERMRSNAKVS